MANQTLGKDPIGLIIFKFEDQNVRLVGTIQDTWWVAADVCTVLDIRNNRDALSKLDEDEKGVGSIDTPGGNQKMLCINESGLYSLIFRSRKPQAKRFKKWVTAIVLPSIRKTGKYELSQPPFKPPTPSIQQISELYDTIFPEVDKAELNNIKLMAIALHYPELKKSTEIAETVNRINYGGELFTPAELAEKMNNKSKDIYLFWTEELINHILVHKGFQTKTNSGYEPTKKGESYSERKGETLLWFKDVIYLL